MSVGIFFNFISTTIGMDCTEKHDLDLSIDIATRKISLCLGVNHNRWK
jgi:hypothetical protein